MFRIVSYVKGPMSSKSLYLKAQYQAAAESESHVNTVGYKIGGLVFTGRHQEARLLYEAFFQDLDPDNQSVAIFHMGVSFTRTSEYEEAQKYFIKNLKATRKKSTSAEARFFAYQGLSFYRFFFSKHKKSQKFARKAYSEIIKLKDSPGLLQALSLDIQAHNLIQLGQVHQGFLIFERALAVTKKSQLTELHTEIEISYITYRAEYDTNIHKNIRRLKNYLRKTKHENDHSVAEIILQIAKLYFLSGDFKESQAFLNKHFNLIYRNQNKRKIAILNTLMAQISLYRGHYLESLSITNVALEQLNKEVDVGLFLPLLGTKIKAMGYLGQNTEAEVQLSQQIVIGIDRSLNQNMQDRMMGTVKSKAIGDDKVGDLFDRVKLKSPQVLRDIIDSGLLFLCYEYFDLEPGGQYLVIIESQEKILFVGDESIELKEGKLTKHQSQILRELNQGPCSKEQLIKNVWGYNYDPLRHDSLIYSAIGRIRKLLQAHPQWIHSDETFYQLDRSLKIISADEPKQRQKKTSPLEGESSLSSNLNYRQLQTLAEGIDHPVSVSEYGKRWNVTRMTALRDLKDLVTQNYLMKIGRGKATRYLGVDVSK